MRIIVKSLLGLQLLCNNSHAADVCVRTEEMDPLRLNNTTRLSSSPPYSNLPASEAEFFRDCSDLVLLTTNQDHEDFLLKSLTQSRESIFITSKAINSMDDKILALLEDKISAGVKVWICSREIDLPIKETLISIGITPILMPVNAKIVGIDRRLLVMGIYDWFSNQNNDSPALSVILRDQTSSIKILNQIWNDKDKYIKGSQDREYRHQLGEYLAKGVKAFPISRYPFHMELLTIPEQHHEFLKACFLRAGDNIEIHIGQISQDAEFLRSILKDLKISSFINRCVLKIVYAAENKDIVILRSLLPLSGNIEWHPISNFLSNSIIVDDIKVATIGSYGWLSSARSFADPQSKLDTTLIFIDENELAQHLKKV